MHPLRHKPDPLWPCLIQVAKLCWKFLFGWNVTVVGEPTLVVNTTFVPGETCPAKEPTTNFWGVVIVVAVLLVVEADAAELGVADNFCCSRRFCQGTIKVTKGLSRTKNVFTQKHNISIFRSTRKYPSLLFSSVTPHVQTNLINRYTLCNIQVNYYQYYTYGKHSEHFQTNSGL